MDNNFESRRQHPRRYYTEAKPCFLRKSEGQAWESVEMQNLSLGGARVTMAAGITKGSTFQLKFEIGRELIIPCVAVYTDESVIGISFGFIDEDIAELIKQEVSADTADYIESVLKSD